MPSLRDHVVDGVQVHVYANTQDAGDAAATHAAAAIERQVSARGKARVIFASAPSQLAMLTRLVEQLGVPWQHVEAYHMDEYIGIHADAPQSFGHWISERLAPAGVGRLELIRPGDDPDTEARRYGALVTAEPVDLTCMGIGVNGHIAFNEPNRCQFDDPEPARVVKLTEASRTQQVDDECFQTIDDVPRTAVTLTVPTLMRAATIVMTASGRHKAAAVKAMLTDPVGAGCPATAVRGRPGARVFLDEAAAGDLWSAGNWVGRGRRPGCNLP
jgi:glucosamine-6-phosphate deaminase